ncbi:hypothetical protein EZV73_10670 [Acidaminobacter sp. JC074]|uniref:coiled-coil domain-containing protein n=1 Tax=Acidaminobacter sp. JC074 TaxID=2530199 RepID=UPI001F0F284B|nr:hypothetical protein [Acidaminobacter sp. JC074]MCH4888040.1 hypothetical protein [Acidaminobacter sp. JC074]
MNQTMEQLTQALAQINHSEKRLSSLTRDLSDLISKRDDALLRLKKENKDVEKIAGVSFQSFVATLFNNRQEKLEKEELEAIEAKRVYDTIVFEVESLQDEISELKKQVSQKHQVQADYLQALEEKKSEIALKNPSLWTRLESLENKKRSLESDIKELSEAIGASNAVKRKTGSALNELKDAKNLGVWDMMGGGLLVTMAKRDHMSTAQNIINELNYSLKTLSKELSDVNMTMTSNIDIANYMGFADYFFDGFFMDMMVQDKINGALDKLSRLDRNIDETSRKLKSQLKFSEEEKKSLINEMDEMILKA